MRTIIFLLRNAHLEWIRFSFLKSCIILLLMSSGYPMQTANSSPEVEPQHILLQEPLLIEHEIFRQGGVLLAFNQQGEITSRQDVTTSPAIVDISCWKQGRYVLVFKSKNYDSIVASIEIPE